VVWHFIKVVLNWKYKNSLYGPQRHEDVCHPWMVVYNIRQQGGNSGLDVCGTVHHSTILTMKNPTRCNSVSKFYYSLFWMKLDMFRATHRPASGAWNCTSNFWFCIRGRLSWRAVFGRCQVVYATWQRPTTAHLTTFHICKTRGCLCSFRLLMIGAVSPETCRTSFKMRNNKILVHCCIFLGFSL
jgi:hypothetical protein